MCRLQYRDRILSRYIDATQVRMILKQCAALAIRLCFHSMVLDWWQEPKVGIQRTQRSFKGSRLLSVLGDRFVKERSRDRSFLPSEEPTHKIRCNGTAGESVDRYNTQPAAVGSV